MPWFLNTNQDFSGSLNGLKSGNKLKQKQKQPNKQTRKTKELKKETNVKKRFFKKVFKLMWLSTMTLVRRECPMNLALSLSRRGHVPTAASLLINPILVLNSWMLWRHAIVSHISKSVNVIRTAEPGFQKANLMGPFTSPPLPWWVSMGFLVLLGGGVEADREIKSSNWKSGKKKKKKK